MKKAKKHPNSLVDAKPTRLSGITSERRKEAVAAALFGLSWEEYQDLLKVKNSPHQSTRG